MMRPVIFFPGRGRNMPSLLQERLHGAGEAQTITA
jgi:hypothetical protein